MSDWAEWDVADNVKLREALESQRQAAVRFEGECETLRTYNGELRTENTQVKAELYRLCEERAKLHAALEWYAKGKEGYVARAALLLLRSFQGRSHEATSLEYKE